MIMAQRFPNWPPRRPGAPRDFARGAAKADASVEGLRALGVWCRVCSVSRTFVMEK